MRTLQKLLTCAIAFTILGLTLHAQETVLTVQKIIVKVVFQFVCLGCDLQFKDQSNLRFFS